jgi:hypothetical protein
LLSKGEASRTQKPAAWPSRLTSITPRRDGCGWAYAYTIVVGTCLRHVHLRVCRAEARPTSLGCREPLHVTNWRRTRKPAPRGIGGGLRREASIEGVRFRCNVQALSRLRALLTHRNLWHAGWRLKRAFRFRKFFGYFLPKKVTTRTNTALCLRHGVGRDAPGKKNPRPAESAAVCGRKLQSKRLGFGADCRRPLAFTHFSRTETYGTRGSD